LKKYIFILILISSNSILSAQNKKDTINFDAVSIFGKRVLDNAGINKMKIDSQLIKQSINTNLAEILAEGSSVFVKSEGRGALSTVSIRGASAANTEVFWNGISIKSPMLGVADFSLIPTFTADKISLLTGGSSLQNSSGAIGGSVNIENQADFENHFNMSFIQGLGSFGTIQNFLKIGAGNRKFQTKIGFFYNYSKNDFKFRNKNIADIDTVTGNYIYPTQKNHQADYLIFGSIQEFYMRIGNQINFSVKNWIQQSARSIPRLNTFEGDDYSNINRQRDFAERLSVEISRNTNKLSLKSNTGISIENSLYKLLNFVSGQGLQSAVYSTDNYFISYNKSETEYRFSKKSKLTANFELNYFHAESLDSVKKTGYTANRFEKLFFVSYFLQITERLSGSVMFRKNFVDQFSVPLIPYLGMDFLLVKKIQLFAKANISRNYRTPCLNEMFWQPGGNPNLKPEKGLSADFSLNFEINKKNLKSSFSFGSFYSDISDRILWLPAAGGWWEARNVSKVKSEGFEFQNNTIIKFSKTILKLVMNYTFTKAVNVSGYGITNDESVGKQLPFIPLHSMNTLIEISRNKWCISYTNTFYSERFTTSSNDLTQRERLYPYIMNNLTFGKTLSTKKTEIGIQLKIENLFNEEYRSVLQRPMPGRNYLVLISFRFQ
jgi:iron complex outermembrane receptor protein